MMSTLMPAAGAVEQPTLLIHDNLQWTRSGTVTATYLITPQDYGLRSAEDKLNTKELHEFLIHEVPNDTVLWGMQTDLNLRTVLRRMIAGVDLDNHETHAQELLATYHRIEAIKPTDRIYGMTIPVGTFNANSAHPNPTTTELDSYRATANEVLSRIGNGFRPTPVNAAFFEFMWEHNLARGIHTDSAPLDDLDSPRWTPTAATFSAAALDEGLRSDRERRTVISDRIPMIKIVRPDAPAASYQTMLTVRSFPYAGAVFPGGVEMFTLIDGATSETVDWAIRVSRTDADTVIRKNTRALRGVGEQMDQRDSEVSFAQSTLQRQVTMLAEYTSYFEENDGEAEVNFTIVIAVGSPTRDRTRTACDELHRRLKRLKIKLAAPIGVQSDLWHMLNPGAAPLPAWKHFAHCMPTDMWAGFVPFTSGALGDRQGPVIAINLGTGNFEPVHMDVMGLTARDMSACFSAVGELGSGKSYFLKTILDTVYNLGGHWLSIDRTETGEYEAFARELPDSTIVDAAAPRYSMDPLRLFSDGSNLEEDNLAADYTVDTYLPLMDISPNDPVGVAFSNLLSPDYRRQYQITDSHRLIQIVGELAAAGGPSAHTYSELHDRLTAWAARAPMLFDPTLPALSLDSPATVIRTHRLSLADRDELMNPHLYRQISARAKLGTCIYALIGVTARFSLFHSDRLGLFNGDEAYHFTVAPVGRRITTEFARDGRKNNALMSLASHAPGSDWDNDSLKLVPTRFVFRQRDRALAEESLRWLDIDTDENAHLVKQLQTDTAPMRSEDFDSVPPNRRGECFMRDALGRMGRAKVLGLSSPERRRAAGTTPGRQATP